MSKLGHRGGWAAVAATGASCLAFLALLLLSSACTSGGSTSVGGSSSAAIDRFTAFAVNLGVTPGPGVARPRTGIVEIAINRWSTEAERDKLVATLQSGGQQALLTALQSAPAVGFIRTPDSLGWDLHYAHQTVAADGSRHVFLATDRLIHMWEEIYHTRSVDYPFMLIELQLDKNGHGEGRLMVASKIVPNAAKKLVQIENFSSEPVLLEDVREAKGP
jgi:hypothetical protein